MRILAVDDDPIILQLLNLWMAGEDQYILESCASAEAASEILRTTQTPFDCILLDIMLPGQDGIELCQTIRAMNQYRSTPILMITGSRELDLMQRAFDSGATDFIAKPLNQIELRARVKSAGMLNRSLASALRSQEELSKLTRLQFDDMVNLEVDGLYDIMALENYYLRFRPGCYAMSLVSLEILDMRRIYNSVEPAVFRESLQHCARVLMNLMDDETSKFAYIGNGRFAGVISGRQRIDITNLTDYFNQELSSYLDDTEADLPFAPKGVFGSISDRRFWSGSSVSDKLMEFLQIPHGSTTPVKIVEDDLFAQLEKTIVT